MKVSSTCDDARRRFIQLCHRGIPVFESNVRKGLLLFLGTPRAPAFSVNIRKISECNRILGVAVLGTNLFIAGCIPTGNGTASLCGGGWYGFRYLKAVGNPNTLE